MRPSPGEVLHFSEDPTITRFVPQEQYVWAVGFDRAQDYWFPRQCPRGMAWVEVGTTDRSLLSPGADRVHVIEFGWLKQMQSVELYAYRLPAEPFEPIGEAMHAMVATEPVEPLDRPEPVGSLLRLHEDAGIELRLVNNIWPWWHEVVRSDLGFSGIRLRNAKPAPQMQAPASVS
jgi:hypothetical protein